MTDRELIMDWLARIGETDPVCIAAVMARCSSDRDARAYYRALAEIGIETPAGVETVIAIHPPDLKKGEKPEPISHYIAVKI